jgi:hypothetical protein
MVNVKAPVTPSTAAATAASPAQAPWVLPKRPAGPAQSAEAHVLANAPAARVVWVCYIKGPADSRISARGITAGATNVTTNIHLGGCADVGGTDIELTNPNSEPVSGTYMLLE